MTSIRKMNEFLLCNSIGNISFLHNNAYVADDWAICGTRGWICPGDDEFSAADSVVFRREIERLKKTISEAKLLINEGRALKIVVALHYPPFDSKGHVTDFTDIICSSDIKLCLYGHLHSEGTKKAVQGCFNGVEFILCSSDYLNFKPIEI